MAYIEPEKEASTEAEDFFKTIKAHFDWTDLSQDIVMDIGCGLGYSSRNIVIKFPQAGKVIAIDHNPTIIAEAQATNPHPNIEYRIGDIEDKDALVEWEGAVSKIVSVNCFHMLENQENGFRHIHHLLKPDGEAAILFSLQSNFYDWMCEIVQSQKWKEILPEVFAEVPESHTQKFDAFHYYEMLKNLGFDVILCNKEHRRHTYESEEDCRNSLPRVLHEFGPVDESEELKEELFEYFLKHTGRNEENKIYMPYSILIALIKKPGKTV